MKTETETPRTNAEAFDLDWRPNGSNRVQQSHGIYVYAEIARQLERDLNRACKDLNNVTAIHDLRSALLEIINQQPCIEGGGCFYPMHDGEGNYIGQNHIDPIGVIQGMVETAKRALEPNPNV